MYIRKPGMASFSLNMWHDFHALDLFFDLCPFTLTFLSDLQLYNITTLYVIEVGPRTFNKQGHVGPNLKHKIQHQVLYGTNGPQEILLVTLINYECDLLQSVTVLLCPIMGPFRTHKDEQKDHCLEMVKNVDKDKNHVNWIFVWYFSGAHLSSEESLQNWIEFI